MKWWLNVILENVYHGVNGGAQLPKMPFESQTAQ